MDRCALFVDAGYVLGEGAMAVHGTRNRDSVSWDYAGVLRVLGNAARDRTGLPLLRCYWYEAKAEGRTAEHEALADLPGVKLRLGRVRPGRREGVESEIHRDLTTLARNRAISEAIVVSAEEDLAQVVSDVQDLGVRVILAHIPVGGAWTVSPGLRQECDDIVEISVAQLQPWVETVAGAGDERHAVGAYTERSPANGHGQPGTLGHQQALPAGSQPAAPAIYTGPVIAEYQRAAQPAISPPAMAANPAGPSGAAPPVTGPQGEGRVPTGGRAAPVPSPGPRAGVAPGTPQPGPATQPAAPVQPGIASQPAAHPPALPMPAAPGLPQQGQPGPRIAGQHAAHGTHAAQPDPALSAMHGQHELAQQHPAPPPGQPGSSGITQPYPVPPGVAGQPGQLPPGMGQPGMGQPGMGQPGMGQPGMGQPGPAAYQAPPAAPAGFRGQGPGVAAGPASAGSRPPPAVPYGGPQPAQPAPAPMGVSLADAVQAAHGEGFTFGQAVARDAPALWLEAVVARKPRMPSDLEARLLQESSLPIDALLHDEVRHALRRGFWDALERVRH